MFLMKCYWMLQNARFTAFTVSELLKGKLAGASKITPCAFHFVEIQSAFYPYLQSGLDVVVCACLYSSTCWILPAARRLWHTWEVRINNLLLWVFLGASAKFLHLYFWIYHISPPKAKTPADRLLERKQWYNVCTRKDDIYWYRISVSPLQKPTVMDRY